MDESNATKFGRLQSVLDMNNITAMVALQEVRRASRFFTIAYESQGAIRYLPDAFRFQLIAAVVLYAETPFSTERNKFSCNLLILK
jgi:hypothetical protein